MNADSRDPIDHGPEIERVVQAFLNRFPMFERWRARRDYRGVSVRAPGGVALRWYYGGEFPGGWALAPETPVLGLVFISHEERLGIPAGTHDRVFASLESAAAYYLLHGLVEVRHE